METHFFKNRLYSSTRRILIALLFVFVIFAIVFFLIKYNQIKVKMENNIVYILDNSIEEELNAKMSKEYSAFQIENIPIENGDFSEKTIISGDTIIKKVISQKSEKNDMADSFLTHLRLNNQLHTDTISLIFQNNLNNNGILAISFVLLGYDEKTEVSGDTINYPISYRTPVLIRGFMDDVTFQGLIYYNPLSIIKMIPRYLFISFISVVSFILFSLFYLSKKSNAIQPNKILKLDNGDYYIGLIYYNRTKKILRSETKKINLSTQPAEILEFFLDSVDFTANKEQLQNKFWQTSSSYKSMTSAINKLRTHLIDVDATFVITTTKGSEFYKLEYGGEIE